MADFPADAPTVPGTPRGPSRRAVVGAGLGLAALTVAGCRGSDSTDGTGTAAPAQTPDPGSDSGPSLAPDVAVATSALAQVRALRQAATGTLTRFPDSRATLAPLVALHQAHEAALVDAVPERARPSESPAPYRVPRRRARALTALAARERALHDTLGDLAVGAQSGRFARLLASMGAAVQQRLAQWPADADA